MMELHREGRVRSNCRGCEKRFPGCHDKCKDFQQYKAEREAELEQIRQAKWQQNCTYRRNSKGNAIYANSAWSRSH